MSLRIMSSILVALSALLGCDGLGQDEPLSNECTFPRLVSFDLRADVVGERGVVHGKASCPMPLGCLQDVPPGMSVHVLLDLTQHEAAALELDVEGAEGTFALSQDSCGDGPVAMGTLAFHEAGDAVLIVRAGGEEIDRLTWRVQQMAGLSLVTPEDVELAEVHELSLGQTHGVLAWPLDRDGGRLSIPAGVRFRVDDVQTVSLRAPFGAAPSASSQAAEASLVVLTGEAVGETRLRVTLGTLERSITLRVVDRTL